MSSTVWEDCLEDDLPRHFGSPRCADFRVICSNGFIGDLSLQSAFLHSPNWWPQCFPNGANEDAICTTKFQRIIPQCLKTAQEDSHS